MRGWRNTSVTTEGKTIMRREHLKELQEGIGFIAIIASLVFVGIETRNSTR